ncbi:alpha/beta fold hydrolase [Frondihabitans australicus]|uniref:Pimeloyl-ACP methyl ester carboxylesterase n=1 Tax=Frondihabitans australicus TaxID=386892 RepID=A0A495ICC5_9MICO|nr:alpha/beta hydrolase [Frondihabitans australicus]RKR73290.1 pimeloyl-ACP methyl ester carboxylesterase [Frondihabitans australicus]
MPEITAHHGLFRNTDLHVDDTGGDGRPIVLIHGWPLSGESWRLQVPVFVEAGYRVVTYDRRGFGRSDKPKTGYDYDHLTDDLHAIVEALDLTDVTLVGFSMGGGEVARWFGRFGTERLRSVVFASGVPPYLMQGSGNPDGPLTKAQAAEMTAALTKDEDAFYDDFITQFYSVDGVLKVTEEDRQEAIALAKQASKVAALEAMAAFATTDFRDDLAKVTVPTLVIHGDSDGVVPLEGSGARTHAAIAGSELYVVKGAPHGVTVSNTEEWNRAVLEFLGR